MKQLLITLGISLICIVSYANNYCPNLGGTWAGTYQDPTHLFANGKYPIKLKLIYNNGQLLGYTETSKDQMAVGYGVIPHLLWANCKNSVISNLTLLPAGFSCGDAEKKYDLVKSKNQLTLTLHWENAMIDADLIASLHRVKDNDKLNGTFIQHAQNDFHKKIPTCH